MGICTQCGKELKNKQTSCQECKTQNITSENSNEPSITNRSKLIIGLIVSLSVVTIIAHQWLSTHFDLMRDINAMDRAIMEDDSNTFLKYIEFNENALLNEKRYFNYIKETEWETVKEQYVQLIELHEENSGPIQSVIRGEQHGRLFTLRQNSVLFGLYHTYTWKAVPTTLSVTTPLQQVQVTVEVGPMSQSLKNDTAIEFSSLYPGIYNVEGHGENIFGTFVYKDQINISARETNEIEMDFGASTYPILTNKWDATLFVDDENTGERLEGLEFIGPIPPATNLSVHAEWETQKGGVLQSEEITNMSFDSAGIPFYFEAEPWE